MTSKNTLSNKKNKQKKKTAQVIKTPPAEEENYNE